MLDDKPDKPMPKGFVKNDPKLTAEIERRSRRPLSLDEIATFWDVYHTTSRALLDPTAVRLENYWWRIWGSDRRELAAVTVARNFDHISNGSSFVPLRGPPNRDEGEPLTSDHRNRPTMASTTNLNAPSRMGRPANRKGSAGPRAAVQMPPPILKKKGREPSTTGPRPTARFVTEQESDEADETGDDDEFVGCTEDDEEEPRTGANESGVNKDTRNPPGKLPNSRPGGSTTNLLKTATHESRNPRAPKKTAPSAPEVKKKGQGVVASAASKKKRPTIGRRQSSQSSVVSVNGTRAGESAQRSTSDDRGRVTRDRSSSREQAQGLPKPSAARMPSREPSLKGNASLAPVYTTVAGDMGPPSKPSIDSNQRYTSEGRSTSDITSSKGKGRADDGSNNTLKVPSKLEGSLSRLAGLTASSKASSSQLQSTNKASASAIPANLKKTPSGTADPDPLSRSKSQLSFLLERDREAQGNSGARKASGLGGQNGKSGSRKENGERASKDRDKRKR